PHASLAVSDDERAALALPRRRDAGRAPRPRTRSRRQARVAGSGDAPQRVAVTIADDQLGDLDDAAPTILAALLVHYEVDTPSDLLADRGQRQIHATHERHRLHAEQCVIGAVRMRGRERPT